MKKIALLLLLLAEAACGSLCAQNFEIKDDNLRVASLDGLWRFHTGDNPAWADPNFDDSKWSLLRSDEDWDSQGYKGYSGLAWYRFQVAIPAGLEHVSLLLPYIATCYQVFVDGELVGTFGKMPPNSSPYRSGGRYQAYALPAGKGGPRKAEIALRVWQWPGWVKYSGGGPQYGGGLVGDTSEIDLRLDLSRAHTFRTLASTEILGLLEALAGFGSLVLFILRRKDVEHLWFAGMMLLSAATEWFVVSQYNLALNIELIDVVNMTLWVCVSLASIAFYQQLLQPRRTWLLKLAVASVAFGMLDQVFASLSGSALGVSFDSVMEALSSLALNAWIIAVVVTRARQKSIDARLLLAPVVLSTSLLIFQESAWISYTLGWQNTLTGDPVLIIKPFPVYLGDAFEALFLLAVFAILVLRFTRTRSQEERFSAEVQAARSAQQFLIPEQLPLTPGLTIESVYRPAREVGGDFFQVIPDEADDSVLIVVGDVAGHGMEAGMMATLIVGGIRMAAIFTTEPERILALLNKRMRGRGLATCLALRIESDGSATLANAGHLPPFLNGQELEMEGALPLGAVAGITFPLLHFKLAVSDTLMLMTDGLAEAQDTEGHLFGFERIAELLRSHTSAAALATAAQNFGQEDDITILAMSYVGVPASS